MACGLHCEGMLVDVVIPVLLGCAAPDPAVADAAPADERRALAAEVTAAHASVRTDPPQADPAPRRFVFAADAAVNAAVLYPIPSGDLSTFFGGSLPAAQRRRPLHWVALGVRLTGSFGAALLDFNLDGFRVGLRPHFTVTGAAGRRGGFAYSAGFGPVFGVARIQRAHENRATPFGMDIEVRVGHQFGGNPTTRVRGVFGGMFRFTVGFERDPFPMPLIGLFIGMALVPPKPAP